MKITFATVHVPGLALAITTALGLVLTACNDDGSGGGGSGDSLGDLGDTGDMTMSGDGDGDGDGPCGDDDDCSGDTYCCAEGCLPDGETDGICIPWGTGPKGMVNDECTGDVVIGLFEPSVQCEFSTPPAGDAYPGHVNVLTTPLIFDLPFDSGSAAEMVIVSYNFTDGGSEAGQGTNPAYYGVIRVLNGQDCTVQQNIHDPANAAIAASPPAIGDITGDGIPEIVTMRAVTGVVTYRWNSGSGQYETFWADTTQTGIAGANRWDGPSLHDLDDDGIAEIISAEEVYDGLTGLILNPGQDLTGIASDQIPVIGDVDDDGKIELVAGDVYEWNIATDLWELDYPTGILPSWRQHWAFADFGTPGTMPSDFDPTTLDGIAELVVVEGSSTTRVVSIYTLSGQQVLSAVGGGGPPTIGDFDADGFPEVASAGGSAYTVFDFDCDPANANPDCTTDWIRWSQPSQDLSSRNTGSSIFDFEGDGQAEAVYADECFLRVYEGDSGEVLYSSFRTSCTWYENPVIGDPDRDENTEILVGSNNNCSVTCPLIDPIHRGVRCDEAADCPSGTCDAGYCRCTTDPECPTEHSCQVPPAGTPGTGNTCRAVHPAGVGLTGLRVVRDSLDRWASSRPMWNQHAYSVTNINDDSTVPSSSTWNQNFSDPNLNNYRQNVQGPASATDFPDITGKLDGDPCVTLPNGDIEISSTVCNRGNKAIGAAMPATFYLGDPMDGNILCTAFTANPVPVGGCEVVSCTVPSSVSGTVTVVVDDDGAGGQLAAECFEDNNTDTIEIFDCPPPA